MKVKRKGDHVGFQAKYKEHHIRLAYQMGFTYRNSAVIADVKKTTQHAITNFITYCFGELPTDAEATIRDAYRDSASEFERDYMVRLPYKDDMFSHQKEGMYYASYLKNFFLFFEQGLGKSVVSLSVPEMLDMDRTVVICPSVMKYQWLRDQVDKWGFDELQFTVLDRKKKNTLWGFNERYIVINYEMVPKFWNYLLSKKVDCVILDEAHLIKNHQTKRFKMVQEFLKEAEHPKLMLLTGTPITNRVNDVFSYHHLIGHPVGKHYKQFLDRYAEKEDSIGGSKLVGVKNVHELRTRMSNVSLRKKTEECIDLPPVIPKKMYIPESEQTDKYAEVVQEMAGKKREVADIDRRIREETDKETLKELRKQRKEILMDVRGNIHTLNRLAAVAKTDHLKTLIDDLYEQGEKCVVFSVYRQVLTDLNEKYGDRSSIIVGGMEAYEKEKEKNRFLEDENNKVMLAQVEAGGKGINLVNVRTVIFCGLPFTPDAIEQPYKRVHRMGQTRTVNVQFLMTEGGIDEYIYDLIQEKVGDIKEVIDKDKQDSFEYENIEEAILQKFNEDVPAATT